MVKNLTKDVDIMENELQKAENNSIIEYTDNNVEIKNLIYTIRGKQVMLDNDVAMLYHYETKKLNQAMKRNIERFPENFCFKLTNQEIENLRSQIVTSSLEKNNYGGRRTLPYAFTEKGIAMLAGVLKNEIAVKTSIKIINSFIEMRKFLNNNGYIFQEISNIKGK